MDLVLHVRGEAAKQLERFARDELRTPRDQAQKFFEAGLREYLKLRPPPGLVPTPAEDDSEPAATAA